MNSGRTIRRLTGFTAMDLLTVTGVLAMLVVVIWPAIDYHSRRSRRGCGNRLNCVSNLKQAGLAVRMWANDHAEKFPWQVSTNEGGTLELAQSGDVFRHFLALTNELSSPKVLACSTDAKVARTADWSLLQNQNLSYFVGLDADEVQPQSILSGDRNIQGGQLVTNTVMQFPNDSPVAWGPDLHRRQGNIGLGDGSAQQVSSGSLRKLFQEAYLGGATNLRLSIPKPN